MLNTGKIYLHKILGNTYVEHRGKIYLHKILGNMLCWTLWEDWLNKQATLNTLCWTLWEDLFTQHTERILHVEHWEDFFPHITGEYCMLNTVGRFIYTQYWEIMLSTVGRFIYTKYRGILYVEHCGKIYLHKILRNIVCWALWEDYLHKILGITLCWTLWEDLFTQNTEEYSMLNTEEIYLHKIPRNTLCWTLWGDLFTQNTEE